MPILGVYSVLCNIRSLPPPKLGHCLQCALVFYLLLPLAAPRAATTVKAVGLKETRRTSLGWAVLHLLGDRIQSPSIAVKAAVSVQRGS